MRITEFATNLFIKFAPVSKETLADLNVSLNEHYNVYLKSFKEKEMENKEMVEKAKKIEEKMSDPNVTGDEKDALIFEVGKLHDKMHKITILEKLVGWLDKPLVRAVLLVLFAFAARYLAKKLTSTPEPEKDLEDDVYQQHPGGQKGYQAYYPPYPPYPPFNGYYPPQQGYGQGKH